MIICNSSLIISPPSVPPEMVWRWALVWCLGSLQPMWRTVTLMQLWTCSLTWTHNTWTSKWTHLRCWTCAPYSPSTAGVQVCVCVCVCVHMLLTKQGKRTGVCVFFFYPLGKQYIKREVYKKCIGCMQWHSTW